MFEVLCLKLVPDFLVKVSLSSSRPNRKTFKVEFKLLVGLIGAFVSLVPKIQFNLHNMGNVCTLHGIINIGHMKLIATKQLPSHFLLMWCMHIQESKFSFIGQPNLQILNVTWSSVWSEHHRSCRLRPQYLDTWEYLRCFSCVQWIDLVDNFQDSLVTIYVRIYP